MKMSPGLSLRRQDLKQLWLVSVRLSSLTWQQPKQAVLFFNAEDLLRLIVAN